MNSIIDDKIFELSTKKENFELVYDINQSYDTMIERLKNEFWQKLFHHLETNIANLVVKFHDEDFWTILLKDKSWNYLRLYIEWADDDKIYYGIYTEGLRYKKVNLVKQNLADLEMLTDFKPEITEDSVCYYSKYNYDFTKLSGLKRLLPETRIELFNEFSKSLENLYEKMNPKLLEIENMITNRL